MIIRIIAFLVLVVIMLRIIAAVPEIRAYMAADAVTKADYLIAKTNGRSFEFPK